MTSIVFDNTDRKLKKPSAYDWSRYQSQHRWKRVQDFPAGIDPPSKVRIYQQNNFYRLQWWEPAAKKNLTDRVDGDLVAAIMRAREIEGRLKHHGSTGVGKDRVKHSLLVDKYCQHLESRVNADEISFKTQQRYRSALSHFVTFVSQNEISLGHPTVSKIDQEFVLLFRAYLNKLQISPNGHPNSEQQTLKSVNYVIATVKAMINWAISQESGGLMPFGFQNPFQHSTSRGNRRVRDLFGDPDISVEMAIAFIEKCDGYQLRLFTPLLLFGLRASEPCSIFVEDVDTDWLRVICRPELGYDTKGLRDKRFPLNSMLTDLLTRDGSSESCLLFTRRSFHSCHELPSSADEMLHLFQSRTRSNAKSKGNSKECLRMELMCAAGALTYDLIDREFRKIAKQLEWSKQATLKDFRHLFSTLLENAGVPLFYRRYLMGHSPGSTPITTYTHLNDLRVQYVRAVESTLAPLYGAVEKRSKEVRSTVASLDRK